MANDLLYLAEKLESLSKKIKKATSDLAVEVALTIVEDLAYRTPVDTSKALSSWIVTLNTPSSLAPEAHFPGVFGWTRVQSANETIRLAKIALSKKKPGDTIYIVNNQDYILKLNAGSSKQAPAGFVQISVMIGRKVIDTFKIQG